MPKFEYKLVPAPGKANKVKGLKGPARFAATLEQVMNEMGAEGWQYLRAETLPQEERSGLTSKQTTYRNLLVFQREVAEPIEDPVVEPIASDSPGPAEPVDVTLDDDLLPVDVPEEAPASLPDGERKGVDL